MQEPAARSRSFSSTMVLIFAFGTDAPRLASLYRSCPAFSRFLNFAQVRRFARRCNAAIPSELEKQFEGLDGDAETGRLLSAAVAIQQVEALRREGVTEFHIYTLNRADLPYAICHALGLRATTSAAAA